MVALENLANDLFLLMVNLTQVKDKARIIDIFIGALSTALEGMKVRFTDTREADAVSIDVATSNTRFGSIVIAGPWERLAADTMALIRNAVKMLGVILENRSQAEKLAGEKDRLEVMVNERTEELLVANRNLELEISEREKADESLRQKSEELERYFTATIDLMCIADTDGYFLRLNPEWERTLGYRLSELEGRRFLDFVHPDDVAATVAVLSQLEGQSEISGFENRYRCKDRSYRWIEWRAHPKGKLIFAAARDVTERKKAEDKIREQKEFLDTVIESLAHPFYIINANDYTIERANSAAVSNGIGPNSTCYSATHSRNGPCGRDEHPCPLAEVKTSGRPVTLEHVHYDATGDARHIEVHCFPIFDAGGAVQRVIEYSLDITDRKKAIEAVIQSEKFRAVADLTTGVAHNFNNLLQIILGNASLALTSLQSGDSAPVKENLDQIVSSSMFGAETVRRLNRFARGQAPGRKDETEVFDLSELARQAVEMSSPWWKTEPEKRGMMISLQTRVKKGCTIRGNKNEIFDVLINLIKNSAEALPLGGNIEIMAAVQDERVVLSVRDDGIGIPGGHIARLFTPFFTTSVEAGRGLGLATCRRIIDSHGGTIVVESIEGKGATFTITLPLASQLPALPKPSDMDSAKTPLTILVVDDMEATLNMLKTGLRRSGHTVLTALSGREALTVFNENHIDFVICDLGMPGMNGWQVAQHLKSICHERSVPKTPLIILTGWEDQVDETEKISQSGVDAVVQKPVEISALIRVIQDVLMTRISVHRRCLVQK